jgi:cytochrome c oxidase subunit 2
LIDTRAEFEDLFSLYWPVMAAVTAIVFTATLLPLLLYRRGRKREPSRRSESKLGEALYVLLLIGAATVLVAATFTTENRIGGKAVGTQPPALHIDVVAFKWQWRFDYRGEGVRPVIGTRRRAATITVPARRPIRFSLTSRDVIHALWIPELRFKRDAFPRRTIEFDLVFSEPGRLGGRCAEFCGLEHADMIVRIVVLRQAEFADWLERRRARPQR